MNPGVIFSIVIIVLFALTVLMAIRRGTKKSWQYATVRLVYTVAAAFIAIALAKYIATIGASAAFAALSAGYLPESVTDVLAKMPATYAVMRALVTILIAPIIFYAVHFFVKLIFKIISPIFVRILTSLTGGKREEKYDEDSQDEENGEESILYPSDAAALIEESDTDQPEAENITDGESTEDDGEDNESLKVKRSFARPVAIALSLICGIFSLVVALAPLTGTIAIVGNFESVIADSVAENGDAQSAFDAVSTVTSNKAVKTVNAIGGRAIYNALTTVKVLDEKLSLEKESNLLAAFANVGVCLTNESTNEQKANALTELKPFIERSGALAIVMAEFISEASDAWSKGENFIGISLPIDKDGPMSSLVNDALAILKDSTPSTVKEDIGTVISIAIVAIENDILEIGFEDSLSILKNKAFISDVLYAIFQNGRLKVIITSVVDFGLDAMVKELNVPNTKSELYDRFVNELSNISASSESEVASSVSAIFKAYGIDASDSSVSDVSSAIYNDIVTLGAPLSADKIKTHLSAVLIITDAGNVSADLSSLAGFERSTLIKTGDDITVGDSDGITDPRAEANNLAEVFAAVPEAIDLFGKGDMGIVSTLEAAGSILDKFTATALIAKDCINNLVISLIQSDLVGDAIPMDRLAATKFALSIIGEVNSGRSYADIMKDIAETVSTLENLSSDGDFDKDGVVSLLNTLTPETATALSHLVSKDVITSIGMDESTAEGVSGILSGVFTKIADSKANGMTDEEFESEADKVADLINVTNSITNGDNEVEMSEYVDSVMDSKIVTDTLVENVYGDGETAKIDPLGTGKELNENEKTDLIESLQSKLDSSTDADREKNEKTVIAVAAYMNLKITITEDGQITEA